MVAGLQEPGHGPVRRVYPQAKFLCLYRHPMDVIASGLEACPWGLNGYGFDPYIADTPGNSVLALARFWANNAGAVLAVEEKFPDRCHRLRYEDLVADPEQAAPARHPGLVAGRARAPERARLDGRAAAGPRPAAGTGSRPRAADDHLVLRLFRRGSRPAGPRRGRGPGLHDGNRHPAAVRGRRRLVGQGRGQARGVDVTTGRLLGPGPGVGAAHRAARGRRRSAPVV
ncbi:MAG TPA: hypothetical protein DEH11_08690 [Actinobacteria bacterium]|nr:hypothetical protein [Actinomycetota bacterium]